VNTNPDTEYVNVNVYAFAYVYAYGRANVHEFYAKLTKIEHSEKRNN